MVEHLARSLKVGGSRPPCAQLLFRYTAGKFRWRIKLNRNSGPHGKNFFCSMYEMSQRHPVWVTENHVKPCNSVSYLVQSIVWKTPELPIACFVCHEPLKCLNKTVTLCAAKAFCYCPAIISHRPGSLCHPLYGFFLLPGHLGGFIEHCS